MKKNALIALYVVVASSLMILICIIYQGTYSYFVDNASTSGNNTNVGNTTEELANVVISDGADVTSSSMIPGDSVSSTFTVQNPNSQSLCMNLLWTNVTNTFVNTNDLIISMQKSDGTVIINSSENRPFPLTSGTLAAGLTINGNTTDTYTITITYKNTDENQIDDMDATFSGTIAGQLTACS